jgi:TRAP-type transport system periplasmic protein
MKKVFYRLCVFRFCAESPCRMAGIDHAAGKKIQMNFVSVCMNKHNTVVNGFKPWMEKINEKTNGKVKINYFDPNTLCPLKEIWNSTVTGAVDIGANYCPSNPGKFGLNGTTSLRKYLLTLQE